MTPPATPPAAPPAPAPVASPLLAAIDRVRDTAKWIIAGFAAVGVALAGESVLSNVGHASGGRLAIALVMAAAGLGGVALAIWYTANVLLPARIVLSDLVTDASLDYAKKLIDANPIVLRGLAADTAAFVALYNERSKTLVATAQAAERHPADADKQRAFREAKAEIKELAPVVDRLTDEALYERVRTSFGTTRWIIFGAAVLAGIALVAFAAAANPPDEKKDATASTAGTSAPTPFTLRLTADGASLLGPSLGCPARQLSAIAVAGSPEALDVVTVAGAGCRTIRFTLTPALGIPLPVQPLPVPTPTTSPSTGSR